MEFDLFQSIGGKKYMFGTQCDYSSGVWQGWNDVADKWVNAVPNTATDQSPTGTAIPCAKFSTGAWHHLQFFVQRTYGGRLQYGNVTLDGATTQWNITAPANSTTWGDVLGIQHQLDTNASFSGNITLTEWADKDNLTADCNSSRRPHFTSGWGRPPDSRRDAGATCTGSSSEFPDCFNC